MISVKLDKKTVPSWLYDPSYKGRKFVAYVVSQTTVPMDAGLWEGGSRDTYRHFEIDSRREVSLGFTMNTAPFGNTGRAPVKIVLDSNTIVARHSIFCGKDSGYTFYVNESTLKSMFGLDVPDRSDIL